MASRPRRNFDPRKLLDVLHRHDVVAVLVGGVAGRLHGSPLLTQDLDLTPSPDDGNLDRLAAALNTLDPQEIFPARRTPVPVTITAGDLSGSRLRSYVTRHGRVDIVRELPGGLDFAALRTRAIRYDLGEGLHVLAAHLDDIITSKEAADRPKDRADLVRLRLLRDELSDRG